MSYTERPTSQVMEPAISSVVDYHDRVRWGPIFAGIVVALATQLVLSALGAAIGLSASAGGTDARSAGIGIGIWAIISLFISLFIGSWVMARTCGPMNNKTALLNGAILWATTLALSSWLLAMGVSGTFGIIASNAGNVINQVQEPGGVVIPNQVPTIDPAQAEAFAANSAKAAWSFIFGSLLGLIAALIGATVGARKPRVRV